ncbi:hypothetical protein [Clostridium sp. JS66]|uniref:hypothetical protein n=1 Tax=Clostridium sp. JS66 TaxID=3064705 RepID=UPI00298DF72C|nr:hypothetical protein [Clostridium sp. JS66]WPC42742.1 hypothetical protein Q6H37_04520 [Clostridium sp. JS66]
MKRAIFVANIGTKFGKAKFISRDVGYTVENMKQYIRSVLYGQHQFALPNGMGTINAGEDLFNFSKIEGNAVKGTGNLKVNNMNEFFEGSFGSSVKGSLTKTNSRFQEQSIYEVSKKVDNQYLKKGDKIYLDNLHKDHLEVFDKKGNAKAVLNLDGTLNYEKTEKVLDEGRKLKIK